MRLLSLVFAVAALAGCAGGPEATQAYDLLRRAQAAQAQISSVSYEAKASFSVQGQRFGNAFKGTAQLRGASFDVSYRQTSINRPVRFPA